MQRRRQCPAALLAAALLRTISRVDGDAGPGIDQEWIDVDRGDPGAGIRHQVGQADQR